MQTATMAQAIRKAQDPNNKDQTLANIQTPTAPRQNLSTNLWQCEACHDSGLIWVGIGEVVEHHGRDGVELIPITEKNYKQFSKPCENCVKLRVDKSRVEFQKISALTGDECAYRLSDIVTSGRPDTAAMVAACREMVSGKASMLTFWGTSGNAKSVALIATVNEFLDCGIPAIYLPSYDMLNWIQDAFSNLGQDIKSESAYARLEMCKGVRVLAVDELQGIKVTDWKLEQLRNLIDRRWRDGMDGTKYTLFAMNEDPKGLEPRIYSRLKDGRNRANGESAVLLNDDSDMRPLLRRKA